MHSLTWHSILSVVRCNSSKAPRVRLFGVSIEDVEQESALDIFDRLPEGETSLVIVTVVSVLDGFASIEFEAIREKPKINAIEVLPFSGAPPPQTGAPVTDILINAGSEFAIGSDGKLWKADRDISSVTFATGSFTNGNPSHWCPMSEEFYCTERFFHSEIDSLDPGYKITVEEGGYVVKLYFGEIQ